MLGILIRGPAKAETWVFRQAFAELSGDLEESHEMASLSEGNSFYTQEVAEEINAREFQVAVPAIAAWENGFILLA